MKKLTALLFAMASLPAAGQKVFIYPRNVVAPRGTYQSVTAIVTGVSNTTVSWTASGGKLVGSNPCHANEPCTIALFSSESGKYTLKATSNADRSISAVAEVAFTPSPKPVTGHPRLLLTAEMLPSLRAKATGKNVLYQSIQDRAKAALQRDSAAWNWSCKGGSGQPNSDQSQGWKENDAYLFAVMSAIAPSKQERDLYGCSARDVFLSNIEYVLTGRILLRTGNRWADGASAWGFTADLLMGGEYLSASDQATVRRYLAFLAQQQVKSEIGIQALIGNYNNPAQFKQSSEWSAANMRATGNNYTQARILVLAAAALTFNDTPQDDPPLSNTCNATRYQVCPDGTAGSLHAYWSYLTGGLLYKYWANIEDPNVVEQAYNQAYHDLASPPMCNTAWHQPVPCLGGGRGGESSEGTFYAISLASFRRAMTAIHGAGYDDPLLYGPQMSLATMSYWDLHYVADLTNLTGLSGTPGEHARWNFLTHGDSLNYYTYPANYVAEGAMLAADTAVGRTDRTDALEWLLLNTPFGMESGKAGNCGSYCGFANEIVNDYASSIALDMFMALPAESPKEKPADPRPSLPADWYDAGNQHIVTRTGGWATGENTIFSYYCTNTQIDHEHQFCGGFDVYSHGEYITKGRMEFNDYNDEMSVAKNKNTLALIQFPGQTDCASKPFCFIWQATTDGGQFWHGYEAGLATLYHSQLPRYVAAIAEDRGAYNGGWGNYLKFNTVTAASRSLVYLRKTNQVIYYDRGATGTHAWDKATYLIATGAPAIDGNTASWATRSGKQKAYWTCLEPAGKMPQLDLTYRDTDAKSDWEIYGRLKLDAGEVTAAHWLSVLQWGEGNFSPAPASAVHSSSGTPFDGARIGESLVMFMHDWPAALTAVTYPASGAANQYVSDLTPNTTYAVAGAGTPANATTDASGVLVFSAAGTGNITVSALPKGRPGQ